MALKDTWIPKNNTTNGEDGDYILAEDINDIADAVIDLEENETNLFYFKDVTLTGITTANNPNATNTITDNEISSTGSGFHIAITGHIKYTCTIDDGGGYARINGVEIGGSTGVYEYSFEGEVLNGIDIYISFAGVTFTEFVKKVHIKDAITELENSLGDIDSALDELHNYAQALIGGEA